MAYLLEALGAGVDKLKLMKLLYISDREHFLRSGRPITGDSQYAMPFGPVPSNSLNLLNGDFDLDPFAHFHLEDRKVSMHTPTGYTRLEDSDRQILDEVIQEHGAKHTFTLKRETHEFPEYKEAYPHGSWTSSVITYEVILKHHHRGDESKFRHGRPVISDEMASHMICPFPSSDADL